MSGSEFGVTYQLYVNGSAFGSAQAGNGSALTLATITSSQGGTLTVQGIKSGCTSQVICGSQVFFTQAYPQGGSITSGGGTMICSGTPILLTFNPPDGQTYSFQWMLNGSSISGATSSTYSATTGGTYSLMVSNPCGNETVTGPTLTVGTAAGAPGPVTGSTNLQYENFSSTYSVTAATHAIGGYSWTLSPSGIASISGSGTSATLSWGAGASGTVTINVSAIGDCGYTTAGTPLTVTIHPQIVPGVVSADDANYNTSPGALAVTAPTGGNGTYTYQWQSSADGTTFANITGATTAGYTPPALTVSTWYKRLVTSNGVTVATNAAKITVYPQVTAGAITADDANYNTSPGALVVTAAGGGTGTYTYQWLSSTDGVTFGNITGAISSGYTPPALTVSTWYKRTVTSNGASATTAAAKITVYPQVTAGTITPDDANYNTSPGALVVTAAGGGTGTYTYQWLSSTNGTTFTNISGATTAGYTPPALTVSTWYERAVTSNGASATTAAAKVTVYPPLTAGAITAATINYNTSPGALTVTAAGGGTGTFTYQWQSSTDGTTFTNISGATTAGYTPPALTVSTWYERIVTSNGASATTPAAKITVYPQLTAGTITATSINYNTSPGALTVTAPTGGTGTYTYQWLSSTDGTTFTNISGATSSGYTPPALTVSTWYERTVTSNGASATTAAAKVTVYPQLTAGAITAASINYNTSPGALTVTAPTGGTGTYTYQWLNSTNGTTFTNISGATTAGYTPPALTASTWYERTATSNGVSATTAAAKITVYPQLTVTVAPPTQSIAPNATVTAMVATPAGGTGTYTYQWQSSPDNITFANISGQTVATYTPAAKTTENATWYKIIVTSNGATANAVSVVNTTLCLPLNTNATASMNYVITNQVRTAGITLASQIDNATSCDVNQRIVYYDGLGAPIQEIAVKLSPAGNDLVQVHAYDAFDREVLKYLPYADAVNDGSYKATGITKQASFYSTGSPNVVVTSSPYAQVSYEASPFNRIKEVSAPGDIYQLAGGHTVKSDVTMNDLATFSSTNRLGTKKVIKYLATINVDQTYSLAAASPTSTYDINTLTVTITKNENWTSAYGVLGTTEEYRDNEGRVLVRRTYNLVGSTTEMLSTYYVYNDMGQLVFVLPPLTDPDSGTILATTLNSLCYQYAYDYKGRLSQKRIPGKGWEFIVYNKIDEVVLTQDANQRNKTPQEWTFNKYDNLDRPILSGIWAQSSTTADASLDAPSRTNYQSLATGYDNPASAAPAHPLYETVSNSVAIGYTSVSEPQATGTLTYYTLNFYDDYIVPNLAPYAVPAAFTDAAASNRMRGLPTTSFIYILGSSSKYLCSSTFYDDFGRTEQQFNQHYLNAAVSASNYDQTVNTYNFDNSLFNVTRNHYTVASGATPALVLSNGYDYDQAGRLKRINKTIGGQTVVLSKSDYNEIGQLAAKHLHSTNGTTFLQDINYSYNERGWLSKINNPASATATQAFGMQLYYGDDPTTSRKQYNGNIGTMKWRLRQATGNPTVPLAETFGYVYDVTSRLTSSAYSATAMVSMFNETIAYDKNGNIKTLTRNGNVSGAAAAIDQLIYTYANAGLSNQLTSVADGAPNPGGLASGTTNYTFDKNGNLLTDDQKALTIVYNFLNLPVSVTKTADPNPINFTYSADGTKLRKVSSLGSRDYISGIEYNNGTMDFVTTEEGRAIKSTNFIFEYYLKDHLGDTRVTVKDDGSINQLQDYYAFGMDIDNGYSSSTSPDNHYKYNGKEQDNELGFNMYDYGARFYDPVIGRFATIDPLSEYMRKWSTYGYAFDNPIRFIDKDGFIPMPVEKFFKNLTHHISSWFGPRNVKTDKLASHFHKGLDINFGSGSQDFGAKVMATHDGVATIKDNTSGTGGRMVWITSPDGKFRTVYMHLSKITVSEGQEVKEKDAIGEIGGSRMGGELNAPVHLHYQIEKLNPETGKFDKIDPTEGKGRSEDNVVDPQKWITGDDTGSQTSGSIAPIDSQIKSILKYIDEKQKEKEKAAEIEKIYNYIKEKYPDSKKKNNDNSGNNTNSQ
jgi:RHS repeat-associated protein